MARTTQLNISFFPVREEAAICDSGERGREKEGEGEGKRATEEEEKKKKKKRRRRWRRS